MKIRKGRFSGTLGQEVSVASHYGQVVRSRPRRPWRPTAGRLAVQHNLGKVVNAWRELTFKQYEAWTAAARKENMKTYPFFSKINGRLRPPSCRYSWTHPSARRSGRTQLGALNSLASGCIIHRILRRTITRAVPARLRRDQRGIRDATPPALPPENSEE